MLFPEEEAGTLWPKGANLFIREGGHGDVLAGAGVGVGSFGGGPGGSESLPSSKGATLAGDFLMHPSFKCTMSEEAAMRPVNQGLYSIALPEIIGPCGVFPPTGRTNAFCN